MSFEKPQQNSEENVTSESFRKGVDLVVENFCKSFSVEDTEALERIQEIKQEDPDQKFVVASSHFSNLDVPATVKALGGEFNFQISVASTNLGFTPQEMMFRMVGRDNFTGLDYKKGKNIKSHSLFNPENFDELAEKMDEGKTAWVAIHQFTTSEKMEKARIGAVYLAQKTQSYIVPTALELKGGGSISFEGIQELAKGTVNKPDAVYKIGSPIKLEPIDVSIIDQVFKNRAAGIKDNSEDIKHFHDVVHHLKEQADQVATAIAGMLPESMRGVYSEDSENE